MLRSEQAETVAYLQDRAVLGELRHHLVQFIEAGVESKLGENHQAIVSCCSTRDQRSLRMAVLNLNAVVNLKKLYFVGFFGNKKQFIKPGVNDELTQLDKQLTGSLSQYPSILSYSSIELPDHYNYANLVIVSQLQDIEHWKKDRNHKIAAQQISPHFYDKVRIHLGSLDNGICSPFVFKRTSFYDFSESFVPTMRRKVYQAN